MLNLIQHLAQPEAQPVTRGPESSSGLRDEWPLPLSKGLRDEIAGLIWAERLFLAGRPGFNLKNTVF